jgi:23S rRNA pseudouridine1911/1915/1917 synthase
MQSRILYEDDNIIVVHKPAGIATQTARVGQRDMVSEVTGYLAARQKSVCSAGTAGEKPANKAKVGSGKPPYVGLVHRLDQPVEGILVFAKDRQSAAALGRQVAEDSVNHLESLPAESVKRTGTKMEKRYLAVVCGEQFPDEGELVDYLLKDGRTNTSRIVPKEVKDAKEARLSYRILRRKSAGEIVRLEEAEGGSSRQLALAEIHLQTGRHHQIRVQMSQAGMSLLGDYKYADGFTLSISGQMKVKEIALCANYLSFEHPVSGERMQFEITPEGKCFHIFSE